MYKASQQFICVPLSSVFSSCNVSTIGPYSSLFCRICNAYADCDLLVLIYLTCSPCLTFLDLPDCPSYTLLHVLHFSL